MKYRHDQSVIQGQIVDLEDLQQVDGFVVIPLATGVGAYVEYLVSACVTREDARRLSFIPGFFRDSSIRAAIGPGDDSIAVNILVVHFFCFSSSATVRLRANVTHREMVVPMS